MNFISEDALLRQVAYLSRISKDDNFVFISHVPFVSVSYSLGKSSADNDSYHEIISDLSAVDMYHYLRGRIDTIEEERRR